MFLKHRVNELTNLFNKVFLVVFLFLLFFIITYSLSFAEEKVDIPSPSEDKVRKAVVNQLFLLNTKSNTNEKKEQDGITSIEKDKEKTVGTMVKPLEDTKKNKEVKKVKKVEQAKKTKPSKQTKKTKLVKKNQKSKKSSLDTAKKKTTSNAVDKKKTSKELSSTESTPLIDLLSKKEVQALMLDVMESPDEVKTKKTPSTVAASKPNHNKTVSISKNSDKAKAIKKEEPKNTSKKMVNSKSQEFPVGQLDQNISSKTLKGWIYLGHFASEKWENKTLNLKTELPKVGKQYAIKTTMVHVRDALPKKGKMGKVVKILRNKAIIKILRLRGLGRNRNHYWAKVEY